MRRISRLPAAFRMSIDDVTRARSEGPGKSGVPIIPESLLGRAPLFLHCAPNELATVIFSLVQIWAPAAGSRTGRLICYYRWLARCKASLWSFPKFKRYRDCYKPLQSYQGAVDRSNDKLDAFSKTLKLGWWYSNASSSQLFYKNYAVDLSKSQNENYTFAVPEIVIGTLEKDTIANGHQEGKRNNNSSFWRYTNVSVSYRC